MNAGWMSKSSLLPPVMKSNLFECKAHWGHALQQCMLVRQTLANCAGGACASCEAVYCKGHDCFEHPVLALCGDVNTLADQANSC